MAKDGWKRLVERRAGDLLGDGETYVCAYLGKASTVVRDAANEGLDALVPQLPPATKEKLTLALRFPVKKDIVLAVTTTRVLVFTQRLGFRSPNLDLATEYQASDVLAAAQTGGVALRKYGVVFADRSGLILTFPRGQGDLTELQRAVEALK